MRIRWTTRIVTVAGVIWLTTAVLAAGGGAAHAAQAGTTQARLTAAVSTPAGYTVAGGLSGVAATSLTNAAISMYFNGSNKVKIPSPKNAAFVAVAAVPGGTAWAGGEAYKGSAVVPLLERWTGTSWVRTASPALGESVQLGGVAATSPGNAWAVGFTVNGNVTKTFILRWNGSAWR